MLPTVSDLNLTPLQKFLLIAIALLFSVLVIVLLIAAMPTLIEMHTFNRLCQSNVNFVEALFTQLRVDGACM